MLKPCEGVVRAANLCLQPTYAECRHKLAALTTPSQGFNMSGLLHSRLNHVLLLNLYATVFIGVQ